MNPNPDIPKLPQRAQSGDADARFELGWRAIAGNKVPFEPIRGADLVDAAASEGHPAALHLSALFSAAGFERPVNWKEALRITTEAAAKGDPLARKELALLGPAEAFDFDSHMPPAVLRREREHPRIETFENFIPKVWCDWIVERARPRLVNATIYGNAGAEASQARSNSGAGFSLANSDLVLKLTEARIARAINIDIAFHEQTNVLHYYPGQEFKQHHDYLNPLYGSAARDIERFGQRVATFLIYLNDDFDGGETAFPVLDWSFKGKAGDALAFWNVKPDGAPDHDTLHAGMPTTQGEKWIFSKWVRDRPFPMR